MRQDTLLRRQAMLDFDHDMRARCGICCGVDEAGRGPLAGDVFAAAVILTDESGIVGLDDSKKLSEKRREALSRDQGKGGSMVYCHGFGRRN